MRRLRVFWPVAKPHYRPAPQITDLCPDGTTLMAAADLLAEVPICDHPREARAPGSILLWRNAKALDAIAPLAPMVLPLVARAFQIYCDLERSNCAQR